MTVEKKESFPLAWPAGLAAHPSARSAADGDMEEDGQLLP